MRQWLSGRGERQIGASVIILGIILVMGYFTGIVILETIGGILVVIGVIMDLGRRWAPRRGPQSVVLTLRLEIGFGYALVASPPTGPT